VRQKFRRYAGTRRYAVFASVRFVSVRFGDSSLVSTYGTVYCTIAVSRPRCLSCRPCHPLTAVAVRAGDACGARSHYRPSFIPMCSPFACTIVSISVSVPVGFCSSITRSPCARARARARARVLPSVCFAGSLAIAIRILLYKFICWLNPTPTYIYIYIYSI